jgi:hypothetical protein
MKMKWNKTLTYFAIGFLLINLLFSENMETLNGGKAMIYIFIYPLFWILTLIIVGVLTYKNRKKWLNKEMKISTTILLICCSPLSIMIFSALTQPEIQLSGTGYNPKNGITIKTETWNYNSGQTAVRKFWKLNSENWSGYSENEYLKDSIWTYYTKEGEILKTEKYRNNKLIETIEK